MPLGKRPKVQSTAFDNPGCYAVHLELPPRDAVDETMVSRLSGLLSARNLAALSEAYIESRGMVQDEIASFEYFIEVQVPQILREHGRVCTDVPALNLRTVQTVVGYYVQRPTVREPNGEVHPVFPHECHVRKITYSVTLFIEVQKDTYDISDIDHPILTETVINRTNMIGKVPCPIGCKWCNTRDCPEFNDECPMDVGGLFVVGGNEKSIVAQEKMRPNYTVVVREQSPPSKYELRCEVRSCVEGRMRSTSTLSVLVTPSRSPCEKREVRIRLPFLKRFDLPLLWMFRVAGIEDPNEIIECVLDWAVRDPVTGEADPVIRDAIFDAVWSSAADPFPIDATMREMCEEIGRRGPDDAANMTVEKRVKFVEHVLRNEFMPHVQNPTLRPHYLAYAVYEALAAACGRVPRQELDHVGVKRLDMTGILFAILFRSNWRRMLMAADTYARGCMEKGHPVNVSKSFADRLITSSYSYAMGTGIWGAKKGGSNHTGVSQTHNRMNVAASASSLRRMSIHINKEGKSVKPRHMHPSTWGVKCMCETPDTQLGIVTQTALCCQVSHGYDARIWTEAIAAVKGQVGFIDVAQCTREQRRSLTCVSVQGQTVGFCTMPARLADSLRDWRTQGRLPLDSSILYLPSSRRLELSADIGCFFRPCINLRKAEALSPIFDRLREWRLGEGRLLWEAALRTGAIEILAKDEQRGIRVAATVADLFDPHEVALRAQLRSDYYGDQSGRVPLSDGGAGRPVVPAHLIPITHLELDPMLLLGACSSRIPYFDRNQSPRNTYATGMDKQAMGTPSYSERNDTISYSLHYPQKPLVQTRAHGMYEWGHAGANVMLAIMCFGGSNVEDSVIINRSSVDRGLFRYSVYKSYHEEERVKYSDSARIEPPNKRTCKGLKDADYSKVGPRGFVPPGTPVMPGDVLVCKTVQSEEIADGKGPGNTTREVTSTSQRDASLVLKGTAGEVAVVDRVVESTNLKGAKTVTVVTRTTRSTQDGDKFSSRHGQKGTVGILLSSEDMPTVMTGPNAGMQPDVIMNPQGMPSRMTVGVPAEGIMGRWAAEYGMVVDGTPFNEDCTMEIGEWLRHHGMSPVGRERMMNPRTGEMMEADIFLNPIHFMPLRHLSSEKLHARSTGPLQVLTRQPVEGRTRGGGYRFGEMEAFLGISHGVSHVIKDRLFLHSDPKRVHVCRTCGLLAIAPKDPQSKRVVEPYCRNCKTGETVSEVPLPRSMELFIQENEATGVALRLEVSVKDPCGFTIRSAADPALARIGVC